MVVNYVDLKTNTAQVSFKKLRCANDCENIQYEIEEFMYNLHVTDNQNYLQFFSKCDLSQRDMDYFGFGQVNKKFYLFGLFNYFILLIS